QWTKIILDPFCDAIFGGITSLKNGGYLVCGAQNTKPYNPPYTYPSPVLFMEKLNDAGNMVWSKTYGLPVMDEGFAVLAMPRELANGDIIACGIGDSTINGCILKTDSLGNQKWLRYYNLPVSDTYYLIDVQPTADGGYVAAGYNYNHPANTWVVKTDSLGCADSTGCVYTGVQELAKTTNLYTLYPNPSNGRFTIASKTVLKEDEYVEIYNMLGQKIYKCKLNPVTTNIDINPTSKGIYLYRILSKNGMLLSDGKFVIQ
ncbi:MAG TPA: T9SS type A sorting domain-containing protein, partial [Bacteroidia bacterium]|nr:T9SS type A sorting domain-containing protein [Bacteroidia bacterium]